MAALKEWLSEAQTVYVSELSGLSVARTTELRTKLIDAGAQMHVVKNRLMKIAVAGTPFEALSDDLKGPSTATFCGDDPISALKVLVEVGEQLGIEPVKCAVVKGEAASEAQIQRLAKVLTKDQLVAEVVWGVAGPVNDLVHSLGAEVGDLVFTLQAVADKREAGAA